MKRIVLAAIILVALRSLVWGNGEEIRYDPHTGVILPAGPTPAAVERETLTIEFQPSAAPQEVGMVKVLAQYRLHNPADEPLKLKIGFPMPGSAVRLAQPPVRLDGRLIDWRFLEYDELLKPLRSALIESLHRWATQHPRAMDLANQLAQLWRGDQPVERRQRERAVWEQLKTELTRAGVPEPDRRMDYWRSSLEADAFGVKQPTPGAAMKRGLPPKHKMRRNRRLDDWELRRAVIAIGQRHLLPEGRWYVDTTVVDAASGREVPQRSGDDMAGFSMLVFPLELQPKSSHRLEVVYRQSPSWDYGEDHVCRFDYILKTVRSWASFGPIETVVKAPSGLVFRSLPALRYAGMQGNLKVYRAVIEQPARNLKVTLADARALMPRLKINGDLRGRWDMLVGSTPVVPLDVLGQFLQGMGKHFESGEVVLVSAGVTLRVRPGEKRMLANDQPVPLPTPVVMRDGASYVPVEVLRALFPAAGFTLSYDAPSNTVILSSKSGFGEGRAMHRPVRKHVMKKMAVPHRAAPAPEPPAKPPAQPAD
jgi:hypothetical protein